MLHDFPGAAALNDADLLVLSVRRRAPKAEQMALIRRYLELGKPLVGIQPLATLLMHAAKRRQVTSNGRN